ncbi:cyclase [Litchfieldella anticariensis FP35 = DSM 16096]|uniref:Cyclase n=1 Tax=Litchfieldella anticariensis (strain DSM 16096 / CECT 5854 / CIP 108499 / LMG 22089 / FP35) TaxID=1121939 RepID=S2KRP0_LITA3|nr:SRPBCC family protein [Halomonas anticariensis]EPC04555.1 cyclase [Halomonas anticariensis FP35 = DSM 16096]
MAIIEHSAVLHAPPERVFALLERVEDFADYSDLIEAIEPLGDKRYRWHVHAVGMDWTFDVEITETQAPERLAWESLDGVRNQGCYRLTRVPEGTEVMLTIEYRINNRLLERAVNRAARPLVSKVSQQILERVEAKL